MKNAIECKLDEYLVYVEFIRECYNKTYPSNLVLHRHHIIPKKMWDDAFGDMNDASNLVLLSVDDHVMAHLLYANVYEPDTKEYIMNMRSARLLNKLSIKDRSVLDDISKVYVGKLNPFYGKRHKKTTINALSDSTRKTLSGVSYVKRYGAAADSEKEKRRSGVAKSWKMLSNEEKEIRKRNISRALTGKMSGANNPYATPVMVNGKYYGSMSDACKDIGVSSYVLKKHYTIIKLERKKK